jgi:hypothetical protein
MKLTAKLAEPATDPAAHFETYEDVHLSTQSSTQNLCRFADFEALARVQSASAGTNLDVYGVMISHLLTP